MIADPASGRIGLRDIAVALLLSVIATVADTAGAALPRPISRAFLDAGVPLNAVSIVVQDTAATQPLFVLDPERAMNAASVMKLVTTFAALDLLGPEYRWRTEAYLDGRLEGGTLHGDLILKGYGDPKITIEQWQAFMATLRAQGLAAITGDLVLDRSQFHLPAHDAAAFDGEPFKPYNVGPDALLVNFKSVRFVFEPNIDRNDVDVRAEPPLPQLASPALPHLSNGGCGDWRAALHATIVDRASSASVSFPGRYPASCGERDWYMALLDAQSYAYGMFTTYFRETGGQFDGRVRDGHAPPGALPFAVLQSPPLWDVVRDVNKLSNNVMARQIFLTLATTEYPPGVTTTQARETVKRWLDRRRLRMPGLVIENGSGLSRSERVTAGSLARLLLSADKSAVREEFANSLAIAAIDGTVQRRFRNGSVAGQAQLKTGTLEGVRALAGYVTDADGRRWIVVVLINHLRAARGQAAMDYLVQWVYRNSGTWTQAH